MTAAAIGRRGPRRGDHPDRRRSAAGPETGWRTPLGGGMSTAALWAETLEQMLLGNPLVAARLGEGGGDRPRRRWADWPWQGCLRPSAEPLRWGRRPRPSGSWGGGGGCVGSVPGRRPAGRSGRPLGGGIGNPGGWSHRSDRACGAPACGDPRRLRPLPGAGAGRRTGGRSGRGPPRRPYSSGDRDVHRHPRIHRPRRNACRRIA